jgi:hypothetical protein
VFPGRLRLFGAKQAYQPQLKESMYLLRENHLGLKQDQVAHYFPLKIELFCQKNISCHLGVSSCILVLLAPNRAIQLR